MGDQKDSQWYDAMCRHNASSRSGPPWYSPWFPIWQMIVSYVAHRSPTYVIEMGCGPGGMAEMLSERLPKLKYIGLDFSKENVALALQRCLRGNFHFAVQDCVASPLVVHIPGETVVVAVEFLEHIDRDIEVLSGLPAGTAVFFTVPDHDSEGHVRHFASADDVRSRYKPLFDNFVVEELVVGSRTYFCAGGTRAA